MFQWWCFVLLHVSVVVFCSITGFGGGVLFYKTTALKYTIKLNVTTETSNRTKQHH
jgi:hypothetical protein